MTNVRPAPIEPRTTERSWWKLMLLSLVTCGIYAIVFYAKLQDDVNTVCRRDGKNTISYCLVFFLLSGLTLGIMPLIWFHTVSNRIGDELTRRGIAYDFGAGTYWGWGILGCFIFVGPFVYMHKLCTAMNLINQDYNLRGF